MALFGSGRDVSLFRHVNRELIGDVVAQQVIYYKIILNTPTNIYGEAPNGVFYKEPVILPCLISRKDQENPITEFGVDVRQLKDFKFLKDDLVLASLVPEIGDIIMDQEGYYEVGSIVNNQQTVGKNPDYPLSPNPVNTDLTEFGWDLSIICKTCLIAGDKPELTPMRL